MKIIVYLIRMAICIQKEYKGLISKKTHTAQQ